MTHGGLFSVQEALQRGVPMLVIPFFNDQQRIGQQAQTRGHGLVLQFDDLTKETFTAAVNQITDNPEFMKQAKIAQALFTDNLVSPMQQAMFWIEFTIRHRGAQHLKSSSVDLGWFKYLLLDVAAFYLALFILSFLFWVAVIKLTIQRYRNKEHKGKFKYY